MSVRDSWSASNADSRHWQPLCSHKPIFLCPLPGPYGFNKAPEVLSTLGSRWPPRPSCAPFPTGSGLFIGQSNAQLLVKPELLW